MCRRATRKIEGLTLAFLEIGIMAEDMGDL